MKGGHKMNQLTPILVALGFNALDLCTGFISAIKNKEIQSSKLRDGLFKKVGFMFCYFLAWVIDNYGAIAGIHLDFFILPIIVFYACTTELVSILENISKINPDLLPEKLMSLFHISSIMKEGE